MSTPICKVWDAEQGKYVGIPAIKGAKGDTGAQGPQGEQGPAGADGAIGPQGPQGAKGDPGEKGDTGPQGPKGDTGSAGANGKSAYQYAVEGGFTGTEAEFTAKLAAEKFANPNALTFTGAVTGSYDGSAPMSVNIPSAVTDAHINSLIDTKLGVIENGSY